jgi:hypothetical protein
MTSFESRQLEDILAAAEDSTGSASVLKSTALASSEAQEIPAGIFSTVAFPQPATATSKPVRRNVAARFMNEVAGS